MATSGSSLSGPNPDVKRGRWLDGDLGVAGWSPLFTLCAALWPSPVWARAASTVPSLMVPPFSASEFSSTAMPWVEMLGVTTV